MTDEVEAVSVAPTQSEGDVSSAGTPEPRGATEVVGAAWGMADVVDATLGTTKVVGATRCAAEVSEAANEGATRGQAV
jgi:hypothetical protein